MTGNHHGYSLGDTGPDHISDRSSTEIVENRTRGKLALIFLNILSTQMYP